jgi:prepilin-type N-terminal cleavage/methylation domain-containing protein
MPRRLHRSQSGVTLIEMMVAVTMLAIVGPIIASVMITSLSAGQSTEGQSRVIDELRQQMYAISRELRSANCIKIPAVADTPGDTLRFTTETQTGWTNGGAYDVRYQVTGGQLVRTQYASDNTTVVSTRIVGPGLVSPTTTFEMKSTPRRSVVVRLQVQLGQGAVQPLATTIAGRNAWLTCG